MKTFLSRYDRSLLPVSDQELVALQTLVDAGQPLRGVELVEASDGVLKIGGVFTLMNGAERRGIAERVRDEGGAVRYWPTELGMVVLRTYAEAAQRWLATRSTPQSHQAAG